MKPAAKPLGTFLRQETLMKPAAKPLGTCHVTTELCSTKFRNQVTTPKC
jgi:hypothetical protein